MHERDRTSQRTVKTKMMWLHLSAPPRYYCSGERGSNRCITLVALCRTLSSMSMSPLYWGAQNRTQCSRCGLTSAEQRGRITSLDLLAILLLMQPRIPSAFFKGRVHCLLIFNLVSTRTLRSFSAKLFSSWAVLSTYWWMEIKQQSPSSNLGFRHDGKLSHKYVCYLEQQSTFEKQAALYTGANCNPSDSTAEEVRSCRLWIWKEIKKEPECLCSHLVAHPKKGWLHTCPNHPKREAEQERRKAVAQWGLGGHRCLSGSCQYPNIHSGLILFNIFINYLSDKTDPSATLWTIDWDNRNFIMFNKKCEVRCLTQTNSIYHRRLGIDWLCSSLAEMTWGVLSPQIIQTPYRRHITHNERLRELGFVSVAKRRPRGNLIAAYNCLKSSWSDDRPKLPSAVADNATSGQHHKLQLGWFRLDKHD
ncbi:hypothetical protein QYF61_021221 [Mycteria americana]|uniref:Uncharacterized protein n=1 Tax=Mycteria americana TaxID=33587 RepID=A0AAN7S424_MYCAM|nr:hypothetical protein QYF61_021221 [Mycteria americana]